MERSEIREALFRLDQSRRKLLQPYLTQIGLTLGEGQPRILKYLARQEDVTQRELADACRLDVTTLSRTLDRMEAGGLLERRQRPGNRRSYRIALTGAGREMAEKVRKGFDAVDAQIWKGFSEEEMGLLLYSLHKIQDNLETAPPILEEKCDSDEKIRE